MMRRMLKSVVPCRVRNMLRLIRYRSEIRLFRPRIVYHNRGGYPLSLLIGDPTAESWYAHDSSEPSEITVLRRGRLRSGARVFNCGAHQCVMAILLERRVRPRGQVIAVEANPYNAEQGRKNRELNGAEALTVVNAALSDRPGSISINRRLNGQIDDGSGEWGRIEVSAVTIDNLTHQYGVPDILFIDVEGFEVHALKGATHTLQSRPDCFIEVHVGCGLEKFGGSVQSLLSLLPDYELLISVPDNKGDFQPFVPDSPILNDRFFLAAFAH